MNFRINKNHLLEIVAVAAVFLILIGIQWRVIGAKELMATGDTSLIYNGNFYYLGDSLLSGHFPYWNPYTNSGEPHFISWQTSYSIRPTVFVWLLLAKIFNLSLFTVCHLEIFSVFAIFCLGCYLFFRKIFQSKISAYIAFVTITFSSLGAIFWWQFAFIMVIYTLPWVLLFTIKFIEGEKRALIPLAFFIGISLLGVYGMFFVFYYVILLLMLWLTGSFGKLDVGFIRQNGRYFLLFFVILFLLTFHLLPQLSYKDNLNLFSGLTHTDDTKQIVKDIGPTFGALKTHFQAQFFDFFGLFFPHFSKQYFTGLIPWVNASGIIMYIGLIPLIFLFIGLFWGRHRYKWGFFLTTIIIAFLMLGTRSFVLQFAYYFFPKFSWIRNMGIFLGFFIFNLCFFVGLGVDKIIKDVYSRNFPQIKKGLPAGRQGLSVVLALSVFYLISLGSLVGATFLLYSKFNSFFKNKAYGLQTITKIPTLFSFFIEAFFYTAFFLFIAALFFCLLKRDEITIRNKIIFLTFFVIIDLLAINYSILDYTTQKRTSVYPEHPTETKYEEFRIARIEDKDLPPGFLNFMPSVVLKKFSAYSVTDDGRGTAHLELKNYHDFGESDIPEKTKDAILGITFPKLRLFNQAIVGSPASPAGEPDKIIDFIDNNSADQSGQIEVTKFDQNRLELKVSAEQNAILYYSDGYDKYWQAYIDGKKTEIYKTNMAFKSIILPAGEHTVKFIYNPFWFKIGLYAYLTTLLFGGLWCVYWLGKKIMNGWKSSKY